MLASACSGVYLLLGMHSLCGVLPAGGTYRYFLFVSVYFALQLNSDLEFLSQDKDFSLLTSQRSSGLGLKILCLTG